MATEFQRLFSPMRIGRQEVKNRIVFQGHRTFLQFIADEDSGRRFIAYQERRALGGAGLLVLEDMPPHETTQLDYFEIPSDDIVVDKYRRMAAAVHKHGAKVVSQILHRGRENNLDGPVPAWALSPVPSFMNGGIPHEMTIAEIHTVIDAYARRAQTIKDGGLDGAELHATHGGLLQQSWSPYANLRQDEYGGDFQGRLRFATEVIAATRDALGPELILGIRVSGDDWVEGGVGIDDIVEVCKALVATGKLDYVNISAGAKKQHYAVSIGSTYIPPGVLVPYAAALKEALPGTPVWVSGRIKDPAEAEAILDRGQADMIGMTRALIADPDLPQKARAGALESIRECVSCRQCFERTALMRPIRCTQNPEAGNEYRGGLSPAKVKKRVLVVGGGPAGLEAARVAAERGHEVVLCEASDDIGGQIRILTKAPTREEFDALIRYRRHEMARMGVDVRLNTTVDADLARSLHPDAIVLATGAVPYKPPIPGIDQPHVLTAWEALSGSKPVGENVVQIDLQGEHESASVADFLLEQGKRVEVVTPLLTVGQLMLIGQQELMEQRLLSREAKLTTQASVTAIGNDSLDVRVGGGTPQERNISGIDTVVISAGYRANDGLRQSLEGIAPELHFCGDCSAPRRALQAVADGYRVGSLL